MEVRLLIILLYFLLMIGCNQFAPKENSHEVRIARDITARVDVDTIMLGSDYYFFDYINEEDFLIKWGGISYENTTQDTFNTFENGHLHYFQYNDRYIILRQSCGTNCVLNILLPKEKNKSESIYEAVLYSDLSQEIIVRLKNSQNGTIEVVDLNRHQNKIINLEKFCPAIDKSSCIDSIHVLNNNLIIDYQGNNWGPNKNDNRRVMTPL